MIQVDLGDIGEDILFDAVLEEVPLLIKRFYQNEELPFTVGGVAPFKSVEFRIRIYEGFGMGKKDGDRDRHVIIDLMPGIFKEVNDFLA